MTAKIFPSPLPGTFYHKPAPDQPAFKSAGDAVAAGDTIGLIEAAGLSEYFDPTNGRGVGGSDFS